MLATGEPYLPNNANGYRTTHTCELCGFEPKTKNKYREKQDHMVMKHFKEKIDKIFPTTKPYTCPSESCPFLGKDKQALLRHYTGKHGILEKYLKEALAEKGIHYIPGESNKRRNPTGGSEQERPPKMTKAVHLRNQPAVKSNQEDLCREVEAMMASFQPQPFQGTQFVVLPQNTQLLSLPFQPLPNSQLRVSLPQQPVTLGLPSFSQVQTGPPAASFFVSTSATSPSFPLPRLLMPGLPTEPLPFQVVSGHSGGIVTTTRQPKSLTLSNENILDVKFVHYPNLQACPLPDVDDSGPNLIPKTEMDEGPSPKPDEIQSRPAPLPSFSSHDILLDSLKPQHDRLPWIHDPDPNVNVDCPNMVFLPEEQENGIAAFNPVDYEELMGDADVQERQLDFYMM